MHSVMLDVMLQPMFCALLQVILALLCSATSKLRPVVAADQQYPLAAPGIWRMCRKRGSEPYAAFSQVNSNPRPRRGSPEEGRGEP